MPVKFEEIQSEGNCLAPSAFRKNTDSLLFNKAEKRRVYNAIRRFPVLIFFSSAMLRMLRRFYL